VTVKVLGISTSPRREGNSDLLLRKALGGAQQAGAATEHLRLCDYRIEGCRECYGCSETGRCATRDDYQAILDKMLDADRLVFATPVFFLTVSAQAKLLIDRGQCLWVRQTVLRKPLFEPKRDRRGVLIAVGGSRSQKQFDCVRQPIQGFFKYLEVEYVGSLCVNQVDEKGAILRRPDALDEAFRLGCVLAGTETDLPKKPVTIEMF
jgi:multimeric flavodoxin WrbA